MNKYRILQVESNLLNVATYFFIEQYHKFIFLEWWSEIGVFDFGSGRYNTIEEAEAVYNILIGEVPEETITIVK